METWWNNVCRNLVIVSPVTLGAFPLADGGEIFGSASGQDAAVGQSCEAAPQPLAAHLRAFKMPGGVRDTRAESKRLDSGRRLVHR